ncbi:hypothetical protein [Kitasatospora brasiliensis]|uniref:hypothetical protein n=1 Tax=Kitasatospora brasiliensis TaxID=3058040 RepID=UPI002930507C|nr:hypothetical protein [Kitasatospora sp. K002]
MHLVHVTLTSFDTPCPARDDAERIVDILWARLDPRLGIEHMRASPGRAWIDLGLYFRGDGAGAHDEVAAALERLLACIPDWRLRAPD